MELIIHNPTEDGYLKEIGFNHEEIKQELTLSLAKYQGIVYDDEQIKFAKSDRATLNKFKEALEDKRKEIKKKCLEPYDAFEKKIKEILALVDKPILEIDTQIKTFEKKTEEEKRKAIEKLYSEVVFSMQDLLPLNKLWNEKWLNNTYKLAEIKREMTYTVEKTKTDLKTIDSLETEFLPQIKDTFLKTLDLGEALREKVRLEDQKVKLAEFEKRQVEEKAKLASEVVCIPMQGSVLTIERRDVIPVPLAEETLETLCFKVEVTKEQKLLLKEFLVKNKIKYGKVQASDL